MTARARLMVVISLVALLSGTVEVSTAFAKVLPFASVRALQAPVQDPYSLALSVRNICTAASIGDKVWLTKAHCVTDGPVYLDGQPVRVVKLNPAFDLAVIETDHVSAPPLKIATKTPKAGDRAVVIGHPLGFYTPIATFGWVSAPVFVEPGMLFPYTLVQIVGAPGNSGSPILNEDGEIISVLEAGWGRSFEPMILGSSLQVIRAFLAY